MKGMKKRLIVMAVAAICVITGVVVCVLAEFNEYKICHNITIDIGGGTCDSISYMSQEDRGANAGKWFDGLRTGQNLADWYGTYHVINDYSAPTPRAGETVTGYYDCVGVTPYVALGRVSREGYDFAGWDVSVDENRNFNDKENGIKVYIGAYTGKDVTIKATWERCSYKLNVNTYYLSGNGEWYLQDDNNRHCDVSVNIDGESSEAGAAGYDGMVKGDKDYSISVSPHTGWKLDAGTSSLSGTMTEAVSLNIYVRPIVYDVCLYGNKPENASGDMTVCGQEGWSWSDGGYYRTTVSYDSAVYIPQVYEVYKLTGWTGTGWSMSGGNVYCVASGWQKNLTNVDGAVITLYALWRENVYNININMNGGKEQDVTITTGYEQYNSLPQETIRPGYNFDCWNTDRDGHGTSYDKNASLSKLVEEDNGEYTIYAQWKRKNIICLRISSDSYGRTMLNDTAYNDGIGWFARYGSSTATDGKGVPDEQCVQIWRVDREGIERTK